MAEPAVITSDSGRLFGGTTGIYERTINWALAQGPATLLLFGICWWAYREAPALFRGTVSEIVTEQRDKLEASREKTESRHEKQIEKITTFMDSERKAFDGNIKEITKAAGEQTKAAIEQTRAVGEQTRAVGDLVSELKRERIAKGAGGGN